jgi:hypothetical protein
VGKHLKMVPSVLFDVENDGLGGVICKYEYQVEFDGCWKWNMGVTEPKCFGVEHTIINSSVNPLLRGGDERKELVRIPRTRGRNEY